MAQYESISFNVTGMHCTACATRLEKKFNNTDGIHKSTVNFASGTAFVQYSSSLINKDELISTANGLGFTLSPETLDSHPKSFSKKDVFFVALSWGLTFILMIPMFLNIHGENRPYPIIGVVIAGITLFVPGFSIIKSAFSSLFSGVMGMDVLIALGAFAAWISSLLPFIGIAIPDYSLTAAMLIAVNLTGRLLESMARGTASKAVSILANFGGKYAHKLTTDGQTEEVLVNDLQIGDLIQVKGGEKIPTDGTIIEGRTSTDESFLTGESLPIEKQENDYVYGGSINIDGFITIKVAKDSTNNILAQTVKLIKEAQGTKVPVQIFVDKVTAVFVPIILILSFLSFAIWFSFPDYFPDLLAQWGIPFNSSSRIAAAISSAIAVLVIACPCALGLATPMALINGSTLGAKKGVLIRRGRAVQNLCDIDIIALDKTGTLTMGKPKVTKFMKKDTTPQDALAILSGLELSSTHPLATAIVTYAKENQITPITTIQQTSNIPGQGVFGTYNDIDWFAGSLKATLEQSITIPGELQIQITKQQELGESLVCLSNINKGICEAVVSFSDLLKPEAKESIQRLKDMGKKIIIITGDHKNAANAVAKELNVTSIIAECSPKQKLETIKSLQEQNYKVCFVGDGINDAAALEIANVGIAMGTGTDIAAESGDIVLVTGSLVSLVLSFKVAQETFKKIKQNLFWAFFYNFITIPLAFLGLLHPIVAEVVMTFSSLIVIGNSLLLSHKKLT